MRRFALRLADERLPERRRFVILYFGLLVSTGQLLDVYGGAARGCSFFEGSEALDGRPTFH